MIYTYYFLQYSTVYFICCFFLLFDTHITLCCEGQGYDSIIPSVPDDVSGDSHGPTKKLADKVAAYIDQYIEAMEKVIYHPFETT